MAPKKPTVTSSSTRSARAKTGSNPVVTKGEARTRTARTTLGPAPKQRPMASGGTKGPLQGGTRTMGKTTPSGITMSGDKQAAIKAGGTRPAPKPAFGPVPSGPSERTIRSMEAKPATVKGGMSQQSTLSSKPGANAARAQAGKDAARMANRVAKGYGQSAAKTLAAGARTVLGRAAVVGGIVSGLNDNLNPNSEMNKRDAELLRRINKPSKYGPRFKNAGTGASAAKGAKPPVLGPKIVGPKMVGPKKVGTGKVGTIAQAFDKSFASARKAGKATFMFRGKKYTTEMK